MALPSDDSLSTKISEAHVNQQQLNILFLFGSRIKQKSQPQFITHLSVIIPTSGKQQLNMFGMDSFNSTVSSVKL